jgi:hypothetical protein
MGKQKFDPLERIVSKLDREQLARLRKNLTGGLAPVVDRYEELGIAALPYISQQLRYQLNVRQLILRAVETIASEEHLRSLTPQELKEWKEEFSFCIERFVTGGEMHPRTRLSAFGAVEAAFILGVATGEAEHGGAILAELKQERTREARAARRADTVEEIIKAEALAYWKRAPDKRDKLSHTARVIWSTVKAKLSKLSGIPDSWRPNDSCDDARFIERVRKRLERLTQKDN